MSNIAENGKELLAKTAAAASSNNNNSSSIGKKRASAGTVASSAGGSSSKKIKTNNNNINNNNNKNAAHGKVLPAKSAVPKTAAAIATAVTNTSAATAAQMERDAKLESDVKSYLQSNGITGSTYIKLSQFGPKRDLTLGGRAGPPGAKKIVPNLNVVRHKNLTVQCSKDTTTAKKKDRGNRGGGRGRTRTKQQDRKDSHNKGLIQTAGIFSQGVGMDPRQKRLAAQIRNANVDATTTVTMPKPSLSSSKVCAESKKEEQMSQIKQIQALLGAVDDFHHFKTDKDRMPVRLSGDRTLHETHKLHNKKSANECSTASHLPVYPGDVEELLLSGDRKLFLMQFPDALPCEEEYNSEKKNAMFLPIPASPISFNDNSMDTEISTKHLMSNVHEGQIGKIRRYKSGKVEMLLGKTTFNLDMGMEPNFTQTVVNTICQREQRSGTITSLGTIFAKITATPKWERLL